MILDLDGVLITNPSWKADQIHSDGYSEFNKSCVENFNQLLSLSDFDIWLSSTRRTVKTLAEFNVIFENRGIKNDIVGFLPEYVNCKNRKEEILKFIAEFKISNFLIIDDDKSLNGLNNEIKENLILTELTKGFNSEKLKEASQKITELIGIDKYRIYTKYNGQYDVMTDFRTGTKSDLKKISEREWSIIEEIEDSLCVLNTGKYSKNIQAEMQAKIDKLKPMITDEIWQLIKTNKKSVQLEKESWLNRMLKKL
ncbi:HAD domain-containing protein [uncultured Lacinutrix sp.]|uniref:HAD domain-containing protein n=1 Tax=uncultured Lacinutrix sp. TaxID=574032 RepID=UPI00262FA683|nr:HAD domain-containing protein [uncultured Lacinutrix sp.]